MKTLSQVLENISNSVIAGSNELPISSRGLIKSGGQTNTLPSSPRNLPTRTTPLQNQQITNALSLLASTVEEKQNGRWGIALDGQYDFIPSGAPSLVPTRQLSEAEREDIKDFLHPTTTDIIRVHLGRLALIKKIGSASEMTMPSLLNDMAFELSEFSELAMLLAFREIKRTEGAWMPELGAIIKVCEKWQAYVDQLYSQNFKKVEAKS